MMPFQRFAAAVFMLGAFLASPGAAAPGDGGIALQQAAEICRSGERTPQRIRALQAAGWKPVRDEARIIDNMTALYFMRSIEPGATDQDLREKNEFAAMLAEDGSDGFGVDGEMLERDGVVVLVDDHVNDATIPEPACYMLGGSDALQAAVTAPPGVRLTGSDRWRWQAGGKAGGTRVSAYGVYGPMLERLSGAGISLPHPATATFITED